MLLFSLLLKVLSFIWYFLLLPLETEFLLRFLRVSKFSQLEALSRLEKYLDLFNLMPDWLRDIDMMDPKVQEFFDEGWASWIVSSQIPCWVNVLSIHSIVTDRIPEDAKGNVFTGVFVNRGAEMGCPALPHPLPSPCPQTHTVPHPIHLVSSPPRSPISYTTPLPALTPF